MRNYIIGFIIGVLVACLVFWLLCSRPGRPVAVDSSLEVQLDTIYIERLVRPINLTGRGKLTMHSALPATTDSTPADSLRLLFKPELNFETLALDSLRVPNWHNFTASLDTIFCSDTISIRYDYPQNYFMLSLRPKPDSMLFKQIVIRQTSERWWVKPAVAVGGVLLGVVVGRQIK